MTIEELAATAASWRERALRTEIHLAGVRKLVLLGRLEEARREVNHNPRPSGFSEDLYADRLIKSRK